MCSSLPRPWSSWKGRKMGEYKVLLFILLLTPPARGGKWFKWKCQRRVSSWTPHWRFGALGKMCSAPAQCVRFNKDGRGRNELPCAGWEVSWNDLMLLFPLRIADLFQKAPQQQQPHAQNQLQFKGSFWECFQQFLPCFFPLFWSGVWLTLCCCGQGKNQLCLCCDLFCGRESYRGKLE